VAGEAPAGRRSGILGSQSHRGRGVGERAWNGKTLRWLGILLVLLVGCGLASYYVHQYVEPAMTISRTTARCC